SAVRSRPSPQKFFQTNAYILMKSSQARYRKVLLIDDNEIDNFINERMITSSRFAEEVVVKNSADAALSHLQSLSDAADFPEVVFLDLNMPVKDGFGFLAEFELLPTELKSACKIVVLSSSISPEDINKASTNTYVFKYVNKPLSEKYLDAITF
ncbi:MAG TPA: response regulator, partial [Bacteroidia bacterium]|nr:response regulator [Bacteroidia bacterium]